MAKCSPNYIIHNVTSHYVRLISSPCSHVGGVYEVPVLQTVLENATIKGVVEFALGCLEVSVAVIVSLLVGGEVPHNLRELHGRIFSHKSTHSRGILPTCHITLWTYQ